MKRVNRKNLMKISELAKAADVSASTIHYYIQQGLLPSPTKTSRNMAYYDPRSAADIRLIQELQTKRYLPLSAIKLIIDARREGQAIEHVGEMQSLMEEIFRPAETEMKSRKISLSELVKTSGLGRSAVKALEAKGFLQPVKTTRGPIYDDIDFRIARIFKKLVGFGLTTEDLDIFRQSLEQIRAEAREMHKVFHRLPDHEKVPLTEMLKTINEFKESLTMRIMRQEAEHFHEHNTN